MAFSVINTATTSIAPTPRAVASHTQSRSACARMITEAEYKAAFAAKAAKVEAEMEVQRPITRRAALQQPATAAAATELVEPSSAVVPNTTPANTPSKIFESIMAPIFVPPAIAKSRPDLLKEIEANKAAAKAATAAKAAAAKAAAEQAKAARAQKAKDLEASKAAAKAEAAAKAAAVKATAEQAKAAKAAKAATAKAAADKAKAAKAQKAAAPAAPAFNLGRVVPGKNPTKASQGKASTQPASAKPATSPSAFFDSLIGKK